MLAFVSIERIFTTKELGEAIRRARKARGWTQIDLAARANVARSAVQKLEKARGTTTVDTALKLLQILSIDLALSPRTERARSA